MTAFPIGSAPLRLEDIQRLCADGARIELAPEVPGRIARARAVVDAYAAGDEPIYGLNTGLGGNLGFRLDPAGIEAFQVQFVRGRNVGVGDPLPRAVCRAALLCRIVTMANGYSGVSRSTLDALVAMFNAGVTPVIPARGSISAADLGIAAHLASVVIGRGEAWLGDRRLPGAQALAAAGLSPVILKPKDGLALCNHGSPTSAHAALTLLDLGHDLLVGAAVAALAAEGYGANPSIYDDRLAAARPARGQREAAELFRALLAGSTLHENARNIQDAVSFRCIAPIFGTVFAQYRIAREDVEIEINGSADTPMVLPEDGLMLSSPNFHTPGIALVMDGLAIALTHLATASAYRITKLMNPTLSGLPKYLSPVGGASAGYVTLQKTAASLHAEIRLAAMPASLDAIPVSDTVEDLAPQTLLAIRKLAGQLLPFRLLLAIEALVAAQAVDLRAGARPAPATRALFDLIRAVVPMLHEDREPGLDVMAVAGVLDDPTLPARLRSFLSEIELER